MYQQHNIFFVLIIFCAILCNIQVYSKDCNCECKPKNQLFTCDCTTVCYQNNTVEEKAHILSISSLPFAIPRDGNVEVNMIEFIKVTNVDIPIFNSFKSEIKMENLTQLTLNNCGIQQVNKNAFNNTRYLMHLNIENNLITTLTEDTFIFVKQLHYFNINHNSLEDIPENVFEKLLNLTEIHLSYNNIQYLPDHLFSSLNNLTYIHLDNNKIKTIPSTLFANNKNIGKIFLNNNNIQEISKDIFKGLTNVYEIYLEMNQIKILPNGLVDNLSKLQSIKLDHNKIHIINSEAFMNNPKLKAVFLNDNLIKNIHHNIITTSPKLRFLNLTNNEINCDCKLKQFFAASKHPNLTVNIKCSLPKKLTHTNFIDLTLNDFVCPPKILNCTSKKIENVTNISCKIYGDPTPKYGWIFQEEDIRNDKYYKVSYKNIDEEYYWANLTINNITSYTKGNYTLNVTSKGGNDQYIYEILFEVNKGITITVVSILVTTIIGILIILMSIVVYCIKRRKPRKIKLDNTDGMDTQQEDERMLDHNNKSSEGKSTFDISIIENEKPDNYIENEQEKTEINSSQDDFNKPENHLAEKDNNLINEENNYNTIPDDLKDNTKIEDLISQKNIEKESINSLDDNQSSTNQELQILPENKNITYIATTAESACSILITLDNTQDSNSSQDLFEQRPEDSDTESECSLDLEPIEEETSDDSDHAEFEYFSLKRPNNVPPRLRTVSDCTDLQPQPKRGVVTGLREHTTSECSAERYVREITNIVSDMNNEISLESLDCSVNSGSSYIAQSTVQQMARRISNKSSASFNYSSSSTEVCFSSRQNTSRL